MAELRTKQTSLIYLQSEVIVLLILSDESCDVATQLGSRKLIEKFILGGFILGGRVSELIMDIAHCTHYGK